MKLFLPVLSALTILLGSQVFAHTSQRTPLVFRPQLNRYTVDLSGASLAKVRNAAAYFASRGYDVAGVNYAQQKVELIVTNDEIRAIETRLGLRGRALPQAQAPQADPRYLNPATVEQRLRALASANPGLARLHEIGRSSQGRPILAIEITKPSPNLKPNFLFDGNHHAREVMTPEIALDVAETLLGAARSNQFSPRARAQALEVLENARIWVLPMLNVDGNNIVWTSDTWWRKNARAEGGNIHGVDINRNYTFQWGKCGGSSGAKNNDTYRGASPGSEPETQAIMGLADRIKPIGNISYHSYGEMVLSPYGCNGQFTAENALIKAVGTRLAQNLPKDSGKGFYDFGTSWQILYPVDGASKDYFFAAYGTMTYTVEVNTDFQPPYSVREPTLQKHRKAWFGFIQDLMQNLLTVRVANAQGAAVAARVEFAEVQHPFGERPFTTDEQGVFHKVLAPGKYRVRVTKADGRSQESVVEMTGQAQILDLRF